MTKPSSPGHALLTFIAVMIIGCSAEDPGTQSERSGESQTAPQLTPDQTDTKDLADAALADLATRLGLDRQSLKVASVRSVTWANGSLGCPEPGTSYTQALVPGFHVVLSDGAGQYHYHASAGGAPFLCPDKRRREPLDTEHQAR
jgi:hypothetical protein